MSTTSTIGYVSEHTGVDANEKVDELAKRGSQNKFTVSEPFVSQSIQHKITLLG